MSPQQFNRVSEIYHAALDRPPDQRAAFLDEACAGDPELRSEVQSLLAADAEAGRFLTTNPETAMDTQDISPVRAPLTGRILGAYEVLSLLGAGGMGEVYLARDTRLGRNVAIKLLPNSRQLDAERVLRFEREARAASALNHPNIVTIYGIGTCDAGRFIAADHRAD